MKLSVKGVGLAAAVLYAVGMLVFGFLATYASWGTEVYTLVASVYRGVGTTFAGVLVGAIWGFVDGLICGSLFAWLYNKFAE
ncbi:MAG: bacteriophage holin [Patescibacteria group bacterium]